MSDGDPADGGMIILMREFEVARALVTEVPKLKGVLGKVLRERFPEIGSESPAVTKAETNGGRHGGRVMEN